MNANGQKAGESGINSGEKAVEARRKLAEANRLAGEAKTERAAQMKSLIDAFDGGDNVDADASLLANRKSGTTDLDEVLFNSKANKELLVIEKAVAHRLYGKAAHSLKPANMKTLVEGDVTAGGYLVVPEYHQEMFAEVRLQGNALRNLGWVNVHPTKSNKILIPTGAGATTMAWTAENQPGPSQDQATGQFEVDVFEAVGIAKVSLNLYEDNDPAAMDIAVSDLGKRAAILEENAWLSGDGNGKPTGFLNTSGLNTTTFNSGSDTAQEQIDQVLDMAMQVLTTYFAPANGVLVSPRRYAFWRKAKDNNNNYLFNAPNSTRAPGAVTQSLYDGGDILGLPIGISPNIPTTLGSGTNEDRIIVGDWSEAHAFIRRDLTIDFNDRSDSAWANRQVHVRLTFRQGFTAQRQPKAFSVGGGAGLAVI